MKNKIYLFTLVMLTSLFAKAQLPNAPSYVKEKEMVRPFAISVGVISRETFSAKSTIPNHGNITSSDFLPTISLNYRFAKNRLNANIALGRSTKSGNYSINSSLSFNIIKFGGLH